VIEIWVYLNLCDAQLEIIGLCKPEPQQTADKALMEMATSSELFTAPEMRELDICRIYLQVFFISDLVDIAGIHVEAWAAKGEEVSQEQESASGRYNSGQ
jgi:hypothetical protein